MDSDFFDRMFHPRRLLELSERNPEEALAYLQIIHELGGVRFSDLHIDQIDPEFLERMFHPGRLLELSERNPEGALAYIQILRELDGGGFLHNYTVKQMPQEFFKGNLGSTHLMRIFDRKPLAIVVWLIFVRLANSSDATKSIVRVLAEFFRSRGGAKQGISLLPISVLPELRWLAAQVDFPELTGALFELSE
jgi:hypothetical protein